MAPIFFVSYAQGDVETPDYRATFVSFVKDLKQRVGNKIPHVESDHIDFVDTDIRVGEVWSDRLGLEISQCRVGIVLMSPRYFTRRWCGQEFQVLLRRMAPGPGLTGIVPVPWEPLLGDPPPCVARIQSKAGAFPPEYFTRGMRRLSALRVVSPLAYEDAMDALAGAVAAAADPQRLTPLPADFDLESVPSAWETASAGSKSHTEGGISKTCFVFLSKAGRDWVPYDHPAEKIGTLAQKIAGEMRLSYEELPCDSTLSKKLAETNKHDVPTVIIGDPASLDETSIDRLLKYYDKSHLPNCVTLIAWAPDTKVGLDHDPRWIRLCDLTKVKRPPPFHEWRSIFSHEDLDTRTRTNIEQIRMQLLKQMISNPHGAMPMVKDTKLQQNAVALGIDTQVPPQLGAGR